MSDGKFIRPRKVFYFRKDSKQPYIYADEDGYPWMGYIRKTEDQAVVIPKVDWYKCSNCNREHLSGCMTTRGGKQVTVCVSCCSFKEKEKTWDAVARNGLLI